MESRPVLEFHTQIIRKYSTAMCYGWPGSGCVDSRIRVYVWLSRCVDDQGPDVWIWGSGCTDDYPDVWMIRVRMCGFQDPDVWMTRVRLSRWRRLMGKKSLHTGLEVTHNKSDDVAPQDRHISITLVVKSWWSMFDFREEKLRERKNDLKALTSIKSSKDCL